MSNRFYPNLFAKGKLGRRTVKNRIVMAPMSENMANADGSVSDQSIAYFTERAKGGVGTILVGIVTVEFPRGKGISNANTLDGDKYIKDWERLARSVHRYGTLLIPQIQHSGMNTYVSTIEGETPIRVSVLADGTAEGYHVLTKEDIKMLEGKFIQAAVNAQTAGCDGVEVHSASGYFLSQFINPAVNLRTDEYGGSIENRTRLARDIIKGIRAACGPDFIVGIRMPVHKWESDNITDEESVKMAQLFEEAGVDYINVNVGYAPTATTPYETGRYEEGDRLDMPAKLMGKVNVPVMGVGMLKEPEMCDKAISDGKIDFAVVGRSLIADPFWAEKARTGRACEIRNCLSCLEGCLENIFKNLPIRCVVNPEAGFEYEKSLLPEPKGSKSVVVIGGGPAGMQAALTASERGHKVTILEASDKLGGQLNIAGIPPYKHYVGKYENWLEAEVERKGIEVELNCKVDLDMIKAMGPDEVIVATGAKPFTPPIKGIENGVQAWDVLTGKAKMPENKKIVIIGGGVVGCETALFLADNNKEITIVEMLPDICTGLDRFNKGDIISEFGEKSIEVLTGTKIVEIKEKDVKIDTGNAVSYLEYEYLVIAAGQKSQGTDLADAIDNEGYSVTVIGDAVKPSKIINATLQGYNAGINL